MAYGDGDGNSRNHNNDSAQKKPLVLKFKKRLYDGGNEIELIRNIERQQEERLHAVQFARAKSALEREAGIPLSKRSESELEQRQGQPKLGHLTPVQPPSYMPGNPTSAESTAGIQGISDRMADFTRAAAAQPKSEAPADRGKRFWATLVMGPLEIGVALVGLLTATCAILTFTYMNNPELKNQSRLVFDECVKTLGRGMLHCVTAPGLALKNLAKSA